MVMLAEDVADRVLAGPTIRAEEADRFVLGEDYRVLTCADDRALAMFPDGAISARFFGMDDNHRPVFYYWNANRGVIRLKGIRPKGDGRYVQYAGCPQGQDLERVLTCFTYKDKGAQLELFGLPYQV
jgi:hypothetical protein